ncbi:hypothetical protein [Lichenifustis flavocetrariae]|uniref:Uncharacterized protein n=1 Tax=Lichenifustis flavocetrariae TaxID=2949735 RepID=A0AA42CLA9_9HYPH|nr:hypothetical protein [Lichenifustis flavocetrariae]MCW6511403.1 hypothetical protein [Lichenifustis flavocetrariae]
MVELNVRTAIEDVVRDRLNTVRIISVETVREPDFDGDDVLRVTVVVDSPASDFDSGRVSGLVRHIRAKLDSLREYAFPMVSFKARQSAGAAH